MKTVPAREKNSKEAGQQELACDCLDEEWAEPEQAENAEQADDGAREQDRLPVEGYQDRDWDPWPDSLWVSLRVTCYIKNNF